MHVRGLSSHAPVCSRVYACTRPALPGRRTASWTSASSSGIDANSLLNWATGTTQHAVAIKVKEHLLPSTGRLSNANLACLSIIFTLLIVQELPKAGRGLVAVTDIAPNEIILSVPFEKVYASKVMECDGCLPLPPSLSLSLSLSPSPFLSLCVCVVCACVCAVRFLANHDPSATASSPDLVSTRPDRAAAVLCSSYCH